MESVAVGHGGARGRAIDEERTEEIGKRVRAGIANLESRSNEVNEGSSLALLNVVGGERIVTVKAGQGVEDDKRSSRYRREVLASLPGKTKRHATLLTICWLPYQARDR